MNKYFFLFLLLLFPAVVFAQKPDKKTVLLVKYTIVSSYIAADSQNIPLKNASVASSGGSLKDTTGSVDDQKNYQARLLDKQISVDLEEVYEKIRIIESSKGADPNPAALHNHCKAIGKINEIGYDPASGFCFENEPAQKDKIYSWFAEKLAAGNTLDEALCVYNTGAWQPMCRYSLKFHSI